MTPMMMLALVLPLQEPAPVPPSETPPVTSDTPPPSERARRIREAVASSPEAPAIPPDATRPAPPASAAPLWFEKAIKEGPFHYAFYYAPDYAAVAVMGGLSLGLLAFPPPPSARAGFGPTYDPGSRDTSSVYSHEYDRLIGNPHRADTVPSWAPPLIGNGALLATGALTLATGKSFRKLHHFLLGAAEAQLATQVVGELAKSTVGRLRPDFRDRMARYYCQPGMGAVPQGVDCTSVNNEAASGQDPWISRREFDDGRRSFPSGHTFSSFVIATYLSLFIGGEFVWGENSNAATRLPGIAAQVAAMTAASLVGASRLTDGRHHIEDVVAGAGLGAGMAAAFYFLHFDLQGRPYVRSLSFTPFATQGGMGVGFKGLFN
jgi:membrane-associated phospholipid phosphatase